MGRVRIATSRRPSEHIREDLLPALDEAPGLGGIQPVHLVAPAAQPRGGACAVPAPARARFYADCIAQSAAEQTYYREERNDELLRFNCSGDVAERFYAGLAERAAAERSEMVVGIRTWRFTNRIQRDTIGLDYCWRDAPNTSARIARMISNSCQPRLPSIDRVPSAVSMLAPSPVLNVRGDRCPRIDGY